MSHGIISTGISFPDGTTQNTAAAITPVGMVLTCAPNTTTPNGWANANGALSKTAYPILYNFLGNLDNAAQIASDMSSWKTGNIASLNDWVPQPVTYQGSKFASNGAGTFIWIGDAGRVYRSTDSGTTWTVSNPTAIGSTDMFGVGYGNGKFVIAGTSKVVYSNDNGATWTAGTMTAATGNCVAYGNGIWVMGCSAGIIQKSTDGVTFAQSFDTGAQVHYAIAFSNGYFAIGGADGQVFTSTDGVTWTTQLSNLAAAGGTTENIHDLKFGGGRFFGAAENGIIVYTNDNNPSSGWNATKPNVGTVANNDFETCAYIDPLGIWVWADAAAGEVVWTSNFTNFYLITGQVGDATPTYISMNYEPVANKLFISGQRINGATYDTYGAFVAYTYGTGMFVHTNPVAIARAGGPPSTHFWVSPNYANAGSYYGQTAKILIKAE